jgi:hypothetical protein
MFFDNALTVVRLDVLSLSARIITFQENQNASVAPGKNGRHS